jgi:sialidase-1
MDEIHDLFVSGEHGYHTFRIPALAVTSAGTVLAFAEGRRNDRADTGDIDTVLRRRERGASDFDDLAEMVATHSDRASTGLDKLLRGA